MSPDLVVCARVTRRILLCSHTPDSCWQQLLLSCQPSAAHALAAVPHLPCPVCNCDSIRSHPVHSHRRALASSCRTQPQCQLSSAGLPAAAALPLQDYNREVLATLTIPNVHANLAARQQAGSAPASSRYWAGDWLSVGELLISHGLGAHYDVLLAAETIYSEASQEDLLECIKQVGLLPAWYCVCHAPACRPFCVRAVADIGTQCSAVGHASHACCIPAATACTLAQCSHAVTPWQCLG
jgi:hypothetical protein